MTRIRREKPLRRGAGAGGVCSFAACLNRMIIDHVSLSRRITKEGVAGKSLVSDDTNVNAIGTKVNAIGDVQRSTSIPGIRLRVTAWGYRNLEV